MLAENFTTDETGSMIVKPKENDKVCHFLRSVQALRVKCDEFCIVLQREGMNGLTDSHETAKNDEFQPLVVKKKVNSKLFFR